MKEVFDKDPIIVYSFTYFPFMLGMLASAYFVRDKNEKLRLFTVEKSFPFALCEYVDGMHINYGQIELNDVSSRIKQILNGDVHPEAISNFK